MLLFLIPNEIFSIRVDRKKKTLHNPSEVPILQISTEYYLT